MVTVAIAIGGTAPVAATATTKARGMTEATVVSLGVSSAVCSAETDVFSDAGQGSSALQRLECESVSLRE